MAKKKRTLTAIPKTRKKREKEKERKKTQEPGKVRTTLNLVKWKTQMSEKKGLMSQKTGQAGKLKRK